MLQVLLIAWAINALALAFTAMLLPGVDVDDAGTLFLAAAVVGVINTLIRPIAQLLSLPLTLMTFGLFALVVNAAMVALAAWIVPGFDIDGFFPAFFGALVLSISTTVIAIGLHFALGRKSSGASS